MVGNWTLRLDAVIEGDIGLELKANGVAVSFPLILGGPILFDTLTWEAHGTEFKLRSDSISSHYIFVGRIVENSSIGGAFMAWDPTGNAGIWTAVKQ